MKHLIPLALVACVACASAEQYDLLEAHSASDTDIQNADVMAAVPSRDACEILAELANDASRDVDITNHYFCLNVNEELKP